MMQRPLLEVKNLKVHFEVQRGTVRALEGVNFTIYRGETLGIIGESGSGKSVTARSIMRLLANNGRIADGQILFYQEQAEDSVEEPIDITQLDPDGRKIRSLRGGEIAMIFQEPMSSLTPVYTPGVHIGEAVRLHLKPNRSVGSQMQKAIQKTQSVSKAEARQIAISLLDRVGIPRANQQIDSYPHQLSGGQRQRVMIAVALSCNPSLLIADEPTTALDVTTQAQINNLIRDVQQEYNMAVMYITHDLGVIAEVAQKVAVMYLGRIVETGDIDSIFYTPKHPYTRALLESIPRIGQVRGKRLAAIEGMVPDPFSIPKGCSFSDRCREFMPGHCERIHPNLVPVNEQQSAACLLYDQNVTKAGT
jgi:oligopeptide/dipeptide ABC transporter ATP-binding protein